VPFGYWEAKDAKDDLDAEIEFKFKRGYPQDNIIFEDSTQAVLIRGCLAERPRQQNARRGRAPELHRSGGQRAHP